MNVIDRLLSKIGAERRDDTVPIPGIHLLIMAVYCAGLIWLLVALNHAQGCVSGVPLEVMLSKFCGWGKVFAFGYITVGFGVCFWAVGNDIYKKP